MDFDREGRYLAIITKEPDYKLCIWDVKEERELPGAVADLPQECYHVSFNPLNRNMLVTSGKHGVWFWSLVRDYEDYSLTCVKGTIPSAEDETDPGELELLNEVTAHAWSKANTVYLSNAVGELYIFEPVTGVSTQSILVGDGDPIITSICISSTHVILGCIDGCVRWIHQEERSMDHKANVSR